MNLTELKKKSMPQLLEIAESMNLENLARSRKQDVIFRSLKRMRRVVKTFMAMVSWRFYQTVLDSLRSADSSYLAGRMISMSHQPDSTV